MAFQPFGYPFEVRSSLSPAQAKAAIRKRKKDWFDPKGGARGWIAGPIVCLWSSALDTQGPMLIGRISADGAGTRIAGRAGSDLNGVAYVSLFMLVGGLVLIAAAVRFGGFTPQLVASLAIGVVIYGLGLWAKHAYRKEAQPLVRFLQTAVGEKDTRLAKRPAGPLKTGLRLALSGEVLDEPVTAEAIEQALLDVGAGGFLILSSAEETYIQTASRDGDAFVLEWRDGAAPRHFHAVRPKTDRNRAAGDALFSSDEVLQALMAFAAQTPMPKILIWEPI